MENWKIVHIEDNPTLYEISDYGRLRRIDKLDWKTGGILTPKKNNVSGYYQYCVVSNGKDYYKYIHRLVAEYFIDPNCLHLTVNHKDGDKSNNHVENLEWMTQGDNNRHGFATGLIVTSKPVKQYTLSGEYIGTFVSAMEAEQLTGVPQKSISSCLCGECVHADLYQWVFVGEEDKVRDLVEKAKHKHDGCVQLDWDKNYIKEYPKIGDAYVEIGRIDNGSISQVCKGRKETFCGYRWVYISDYYKLR